MGFVGFFLAGLSGCQHPGYLSADEPCKGPNLKMVQQAAADARDQEFVVSGIDGGGPRGGPQKCRLHGTINLQLTIPGEKALAHLQVPFNATVGGGLGPMVVTVRWSNWCLPDRHGALAYQFRTDDSGSDSALSLTEFPECRRPGSPTTLRRI